MLITTTVAMTVLRAFLMAAFGGAIAKGYITSDQITELAGWLMTGLVGLWTAYVSYSKHRALSDAKAVATTATAAALAQNITAEVKASPDAAEPAIAVSPVQPTKD